jgi:signal transduction histidine kinase
VTPTKDSFAILKIDSPINPVQEGDRIKSISGIPYYQFLAPSPPVFTSSRQSRTAIIERDGAQISIPIQFERISWQAFLIKTWPNYLLIAILSVCGLIAVLLSAPKQPAPAFFSALIASAMVISSQLPFFFAQLQPGIISASFLVMTIGNWVMFSSWAHYCLNFPLDRQLLTGHPLLVVLIYLLPPTVAITTAYLWSGGSIEFWGWLQRVRRWSIPLIIFGTYGKHLYDFFTSRSQVVRNQLKAPLTASWIGLGPYVFLYLLPSLFLGHPLITFRLVVMSGLILPLTFLYVMIRYRLLEIDEAISNSLAYFVLTITVYIFFALSLSLVNRVVGFQAQHLIFPFLVLVVIFLNPVRNRIKGIIDRLIFANRFDLTPLLQSFSKRLTTTIKMDDLAAMIVDELPKIFKVERAALEIVKGKWRQTFSSESDSDKIPRSLGVLLYNLENHHATLSSFESQPNPKLAAAVADIFGLGYVLILGLKSGEKLVGVLFLGLKTNNRMYTAREIQALKTLANQVALALENAINNEALTESRDRINKMYKKLIRSEKLANIGEMASMLAHEIKNPLAIIRSSAQYLTSGTRDEQTQQELLEYIVDEVDTLNLVFSNMLGISGYKNPTIAEFDLTDTLEKVLDRWESGYDHNRHVTIVRRYPSESFLIMGDPKQISQLLVNLIRNAEQSIVDQGDIFINVDQNDEDDFLKITIQDTGTGIAEENSAHVFRKFFTTKEKGLGLGLPLCRQIVEAHKGFLNLDNNPDRGAVVTIRLPKRLDINPSEIQTKQVENANDIKNSGDRRRSKDATVIAANAGRQGL